VIPITMTKPNPVRRPDSVLLLQTWSTATIQTTNSRMAPEATILIHIFHSPAHHQELDEALLAPQAQASQVGVICGSGAGRGLPPFKTRQAPSPKGARSEKPTCSFRAGSEGE
jgi:hypothetical protein